MRINCHVPVTLRIIGVPTEDQLAAAGKAVVRTVTARLAEAERLLADRYGVTAGGPVELREAYDPDRAVGDGYAIPSYQEHGAPTVVPVSGGSRPPDPPDEPLHPDALAFLEGRLRQFYELLPRQQRINLKRNGTLAVGMVTIDGDVRLVYTVNNNRVTGAMRAAAEQLAITFWDARGRAEGRGSVGAPNDAEQLMESAADANDAVLHGMVVSRRLCLDCAHFVVRRNPDGTVKARYTVREIGDPIEIPRTPRPPRPQPAPPRAAESTEARPESAAARTEPRPGQPAAQEAPAGQGPAGRQLPATPDAVAPPPSVQARPDAVPARSTGAPPRPVELDRSTVELPARPAVEGRGGVPSGFEVAVEAGPRGGVEGAAQAILNAQFQSVERYQNEAAQDAFDKLYREKIAPLLAQGMAVTVEEVWEVPESVDIAAEVTGVRDAGQVRTFKDMYILSASPYHPAKAGDAPQSAYRADYAPDAGHGAWYEYELRTGIHPRKYFKLARYRRELLPQVPGEVTTYAPQAMQFRYGDEAQARRYGMGRILQFERRPMSLERKIGWSTLENRFYVVGPLVGDGLPESWTLGDLGKPEYLISSQMSWLDQKHDTLLERAYGEDLDPRFPHQWHADFIWVRKS